MPANTTIPARVAQDEIRDVYARVAPVYDVWARLTETRARRRCLELARVRDGEDVLEVAVGTGLAFAEIVRANPSGVTEGIDLTEAMLARAEVKVAELPGRHRLQVGDARRLPFADVSFDLIVNNYMFDLLPEQDFAPVLHEFRRVLRPGGRIALVNLAEPERIASRLWTAIYRINPKWMGGCRPVALAEHLDRAGFVGVTRETLTQLTFPSEILTAQRARNDGD
jgi:ubiquinone/menaquinone biosynthesis C-methylase UbiE